MQAPRLLKKSPVVTYPGLLKVPGIIIDVASACFCFSDTHLSDLIDLEMGITN